MFEAIKKHDTKGLMYKYLVTATSSKDKTSGVSEPQNKKKKMLKALTSPSEKKSMANTNSSKIVDKHSHIGQPTKRTNKELIKEFLNKATSQSEVVAAKDKATGDSGSKIDLHLQKLKSFDETKLVIRNMHLR